MTTRVFPHIARASCLWFGIALLLLPQGLNAGQWVYSGYQSAPIPDQIAVPIVTNIKAIAAGGGNIGGTGYEMIGHTVALKQDDSIVAWGSNYWGETSVPTAAQGGVTAISAGGYVTFYQLKGVPATPTITQVRAAQIPGTHRMRITYDLTASAPCTVGVQAWLENPGISLFLPPIALSGDVTGTNGIKVSPGNGKAIELDAAKADALKHIFTKQLRFKVTGTP